MLKTLFTNIRWSLSMRGEPGECAFLRSALPVTGRRIRPRTSPFEEKTFYSANEERAIVLDEIAGLPDRVDLQQLVRAIKAGIDVDGDGVVDLYSPRTLMPSSEGPISSTARQLLHLCEGCTIAVDQAWIFLGKR